MTNRLKGLDLIDRVPEELWTEVRDNVQEAGIKTIPPKKKKCKKAKWLSDEALQIAKKGCTTMTQTQKYIPKISLLGIDLEYNQLLTGLLCLKTF